MAAPRLLAARDSGDATATATNATATASSTSASSSDVSGGSSTNGLYLYTFLITLLILLGVSCGIVARSLVLRRRFRRQMEEAIASGMTLPSRAPAPRSRRHHFGDKPVMHGVVLNEKASSSLLGLGAGQIEAKKGDMSWLNFKPVSAAILLPQDKASPAGTEERIVITPQIAYEYFGIDLRTTRETFRDSWQSFSRWRRRVSTHVFQPRPTITPPPSRRPSRQNLSAAATLSPSSPVDRAVTVDMPDEKEKEKEKTLAVGVMIAMPNPARPTYTPKPSPSPSFIHDEIEEDERPQMSATAIGKMKAVPAEGGETELPEIALGVIESDWTGKPSLVPPKPPSKRPEAKESGRSGRTSGRFRRGLTPDRERVLLWYLREETFG